MTLKGVNIVEKNVRKTRLSVVFIFFDHVAPPLWGLKKIYIISKGKTNFLIKNPARGPPQIFFLRIFEIFKPPKTSPNMRKKIWKNSHVYTCLLTILCENFKIFEPSPSKVWIFEFWLFAVTFLGLGWGGRSKNFFEKVLHQD